MDSILSSILSSCSKLFLDCWGNSHHKTRTWDHIYWQIFSKLIINHFNETKQRYHPHPYFKKLRYVVSYFDRCGLKTYYFKLILRIQKQINYICWGKTESLPRRKYNSSCTMSFERWMKLLGNVILPTTDWFFRVFNTVPLKQQIIIFCTCQIFFNEGYGIKTNKILHDNFICWSVSAIYQMTSF